MIWKLLGKRKHKECWLLLLLLIAVQILLSVSLSFSFSFQLVSACMFATFSLNQKGERIDLNEVDSSAPVSVEGLKGKQYFGSWESSFDFFGTAWVLDATFPRKMCVWNKSLSFTLYYNAMRSGRRRRSRSGNRCRVSICLFCSWQWWVRWWNSLHAFLRVC